MTSRVSGANLAKAEVEKAEAAALPHLAVNRDAVALLHLAVNRDAVARGVVASKKRFKIAIMKKRARSNRIGSQ
jgi:hypothetical protein